uniref:Ig-like domain-containing protein n=1 Tax=Echeneis naucrates TaxID=173247 RepID=A0A665TFU8_ECHNA
MAHAHTRACPTYTQLKNITALPGENVLLPCRVPNTTIIVLEWVRSDLLSQYVFMYKDKKPLSENQHPSFKGRVELAAKHMKDGNISVILKNVTTNDSGTYTCEIIQSQRKRRRRRKADFMPIISITLDVHRVEEAGNSSHHYGLAAFVILLLVLSITWLTHKMTKRKAQLLADPVVAAGIQQ